MRSANHWRSLMVALNTLMLVFVFLGSSSSCAAAQPADSVQYFYKEYLEVHKSGGLPTEPELAILRASFSKRLYALLRDALKYQSDWAKSHPSKLGAAGAPPVIYKPPFIDGEYFVSNFEGFKRFSVTRTQVLTDRRWQIVVHFWYEPESAGWEDSMIVIREDGHYVIDDVLFAGHGTFNPPGRLSELLLSRSQE